MQDEGSSEKRSHRGRHHTAEGGVCGEGTAKLPEGDPLEQNWAGEMSLGAAENVQEEIRLSRTAGSG